MLQISSVVPIQQQADACESDADAAMQEEEELLEVQMSDGSVQYLTEAEYLASIREQMNDIEHCVVTAVAAPAGGSLCSLQSPWQHNLADHTSQPNVQQRLSDGHAAAAAEQAHQQRAQQLPFTSNSFMGHTRTSSYVQHGRSSELGCAGIQHPADVYEYDCMDIPAPHGYGTQHDGQPITAQFDATPEQMLPYYSQDMGAATVHDHDVIQLTQSETQEGHPGSFQTQQLQSGRHGRTELAIAIGTASLPVSVAHSQPSRHAYTFPGCYMYTLTKLAHGL